jgi:hypothetical protein
VQTEIIENTLGMEAGMKGQPLVTYACAAVLTLFISVQAWAAMDENFMVTTTGDLTTLCSPGDQDPNRVAAVNFCRGYIIGWYQYHTALAKARTNEIVCLPSKPPTLDEGIREFVSWAKANTNHMNEPPVDGLLRFLSEKWPCKK